MTGKPDEKWQSVGWQNYRPISIWLQNNLLC